MDKVITYIKSFNLTTVVAPFETTIEGDYDVLMEIVKGCQLICINEGAPDVMTYVKIHYSINPEFLSIKKKISKYNKGNMDYDS